jgi:LysR family glycine cleavage system transcriptional activator
MMPADVDMAIVFSAHAFPGCTVTPLMRTAVFPVCAPDVPRGPLPMNPQILQRATIIHEDEGDIWAQWFASRGLEQFRPLREIHAGSHHDAVAFARQGAGYAMTDWFLGGSDLRGGRLVQAFGPQELDYDAYYIVNRTSQREDSPARALSDWLHREAQVAAIKAK